MKSPGTTEGLKDNDVWQQSQQPATVHNLGSDITSLQAHAGLNVKCGK